MCIDPTLALIEPDARFEESYVGLVAEFVESGEPLIPFPLSFPHDDFPAFLERLAACSRGEGSPPGFVAHSTYWLVRDDREVVGVSNLRHELTESLRHDGGHIGYGVRPSARGNGYAVELLRRTLRRAEALGLSEVLITCDRGNVASARTILRNGGILESEDALPDTGKVVQRYRVSVGSSTGERDGGMTT